MSKSKKRKQSRKIRGIIEIVNRIPRFVQEELEAKGYEFRRYPLGFHFAGVHAIRFTENGILIKSGEVIDADIIVSATGIEINALNDINVSIDQIKVEPHNKLSYKGMMLSGVPNLAFSFGYVNASWTLRADLTCEYVCRLLNQMDKQGVTTCIPEEDPNAIVDDEYIDFTSGYVQRALNRLPKQGKKSPWRQYQNYLKDIFLVRLFSIKDSTLKFYNPK